MNNIENLIELDSFIDSMNMTTKYNIATTVFNAILSTNNIWHIRANDLIAKIAVTEINGTSVKLIFKKNSFEYLSCKNNTIVYNEKVYIKYSDIQDNFVEPVYTLFMELMCNAVDKIFASSYNE